MISFSSPSSAAPSIALPSAPRETRTALSIHGRSLSRFLHCFGNECRSADLATVMRMLEISGSNVIPINTYADAIQEYTLRIGCSEFGEVIARQLPLLGDKRNVLVLNIQRSHSAREAVERAKFAVKLTSERFIKLEVLHVDNRHSHSAEMVEAVAQLRSWDPSLTILPQIECDVEVAQSMIELGCPMLRVMGSPIGSHQGLIHPEEFGKICALGAPVFLDGGIGHPDHCDHAVALGASGVLVNSALFSDERISPAERLAPFVSRWRMIEAGGAFDRPGLGR